MALYGRASKPREPTLRGKLQRQQQSGAPLGGAAAGTHREGVREGAVAERNDSSSLSTAAAIATAADAAEAVVAVTRWCGSQEKAKQRCRSFMDVRGSSGDHPAEMCRLNELC